MNKSKLSRRITLKNSLIPYLLMLNLFGFAAASGYFNTRSETLSSESGNKVFTYFYSGWQVVEKSFSLIDYLNQESKQR